MQPLIVFLTLVALFSNLAAAATYSQQLCTTKAGTKSVKPVPSTTYALTLTLTTTARVTSTPLTTTTPKAVTTTVSTTIVVTTTTTAPALTGSVTTTVTNTQSATITTTSTETDTATTSTTTTVASGTSTVPTPAGFTAISQEPGFQPKVKVREALGVAARAAAPSQTVVKLLSHGKGCTISPQLYPTSVICGQLVESVTTKTTTATATGTSTITAATPTSTVTSTITSTVTNTVYPAMVTLTTTTTVSTTLTTTQPATATTTTTTTSTATVATYASTAYAACASSNIVTNANNGNTISEVDGGVGNSASFVSVSSPYDCCVACITSTSNCRGFVYIGISGFECELITGNTCDPGVAYGGEQFLTDSSSTDPGLPIGNGACGIIADGGSIPASG